MGENHSHVVLGQTWPTFFSAIFLGKPNFTIFYRDKVALFAVSARILGFQVIPSFPSLEIYGVEETAPFPCALNAGIMGANAKVPCFAGDCGPLACQGLSWPMANWYSGYS